MRRSIMNANYGREVRLNGEELERARTAESELVSSLNSMAGLIMDAVEGSSERTVTVDVANYARGVSTLFLHGPEHYYAYAGQAGVGHPCTPDEAVGGKRGCPSKPITREYGMLIPGEEEQSTASARYSN